MAIIVGSAFKKIYGNVFYKILNDSLSHIGFTYKFGENIDTMSFDFNDGRGGLHFTTLENLWIFRSFGNLVAKINIDDDDFVMCYEDDTEFKVHKLTIIEIIPFMDFINSDIVISLSCVKFDGLMLKYIQKQTPEICLESILQNDRALYFIEEQIYIDCIEYVKQNKMKSIEKQTLDVISNILNNA